jgi:hypothetical protein
MQLASVNHTKDCAVIGAPILGNVGARSNQRHIIYPLRRTGAAAIKSGQE